VVEAVTIDLAIAPAIARSADHFYTYEGERYPGVTGILQVLGANFSVAARYGAKQAATVAADLVDSGTIFDLWQAQKRDGFIAGMTASAVNHRNEAAALGTDVHAMAELVVRGEPTPAKSLAPIVAPTGSPKAYPMPKVDRHVVLHVTTEGVREVEIAVGTAEHMAWLACIDLHSWAESMKGKKF
jgi:hypothetical protein